jgi:hypothetical protein
VRLPCQEKGRRKESHIGRHKENDINKIKMIKISVNYVTLQK